MSPYTRETACKALATHVRDGIYPVLAALFDDLHLLHDGLGETGVAGDPGDDTAAQGPSLWVGIQGAGERLYGTQVEIISLLVVFGLDFAPLAIGKTEAHYADRVREVTTTYLSTATCTGGWVYQATESLPSVTEHAGVLTRQDWQVAGYVLTQATPPTYLTSADNGLPLISADDGRVIFSAS
jgi:hypothetical protein